MAVQTGDDHRDGARAPRAVGIAPLHRPEDGLAGFLVSGRWPDSTREWVQLLTLAVRVATTPGLLPTTSLFSASETRPDDDRVPDAVGLVRLVGRALDPAVAERRPSEPPVALLLLHPPAETPTTTPEVDVVASGCVLLPGAPHLGLDHRAAWVEAEPDGTVTRLVSRRGVDPAADVDTAVLAMLMAA
ncbi:peptidase [Aquipuribacter nitratireducens]|uniref:peptidase n=1 Tax=Aquipuribacter nitratireducens TaxID=650104 RepID=UPI0030EBF26C